MTTKIGIETIVNYIDEKLLVSDLGDESVMMNIESGDYFGLNEVGTTIWHLIQEPIQVKDICNKLLEEFDIDEQTCTEKTVEYLQNLLEEELITIQ